MPATSTPYGFRAVTRVGQRYTGSSREYVITTNNAAAIFAGDVVTINGGVISAITATPTTTRSANTPIGVFVGCEYIDPVSGLRESHYLPANAVNAGYTKIRVIVEDDPNNIYQVQASGSVPLTSIGQNAAIKNFAAGSTFTGNSGMQIDSTTVAITPTLAVRIVDLVNPTSSTGLPSQPGDAFTDLLVRFNVGVHAYENATGA